MSQPRARLLAVATTLLAPALVAAAQQTLVVTTVAGAGPNNVPALAANISLPLENEPDAFGNLYILKDGGRIYRVDPAGLLTIFTASVLSAGLATAPNRDVYVAETHRVSRINPATGLIQAVAGNGVKGFSGDGGLATEAQLNSPSQVAFAPNGDLYILDRGNVRVRRVRDEIITTVAGNGLTGFAGDGEPAELAKLNNPSDIALDSAGNLYIADSFNRRVRRVDASTGVISTVAGTGAQGSTGDNGPAVAATFQSPHRLVLDGQGNLFISDRTGNRVRRVDAVTGVITTYAGTGIGGFSGEGGPAGAARLSNPYGIAVDASGGLLIADSLNHRIRRVDRDTGIISTIAGNGTISYSGDGGLALDASLSPTGVASDAAGNILIADTGNHRIRRIDRELRTITTVAGGGTGGDGPAIEARLSSPKGVLVDAGSNILFADSNNSRIRRVDAVSGILTTVAGGGTAACTMEGIPATQACLALPQDIAQDAVGDLYIADFGRYRVRRVSATTGLITTVAGDGRPTFTGEGGQATATGIGEVNAVAIDRDGNLLIARSDFVDFGLVPGQILRVDHSTGILTRVAGISDSGPLGDGGPALDAYINNPTDLVVDQNNDILVADTENRRVRRIDAVTGLITTVAGCESSCSSADGIPPDQALLPAPSGITLDPASHLLFVTGGFELKVRKVAPSNSPPRADAGADARHECISSAGALATLDGTASDDPDSLPGTNDDIQRYEWFEDFFGPTATLLGEGATLNVSLPLGVHAITLRVTDYSGDASTDDVVIEVSDTTPPQLTLAANPGVLWPPNHRMVDVAIAVQASDLCGLATASLVSAQSSEADDLPGPGDGNTHGDIAGADLGTADANVELRAERDPGGPGRQYTLVYTATDASGNIVQSAALVMVPHDQSGLVDPVDVRVEETPPGTLIEWSQAPGASVYDVARGRLASLRMAGESIDLGEIVCIETGSADTDTRGREDADDPQPGEGFFYLVQYLEAGWSGFGEENVAGPRLIPPGGCR